MTYFHPVAERIKTYYLPSDTTLGELWQDDFEGGRSPVVLV